MSWMMSTSLRPSSRGGHYGESGDGGGGGGGDHTFKCLICAGIIVIVMYPILVIKSGFEHHTESIDLKYVPFEGCVLPVQQPFYCQIVLNITSAVVLAVALAPSFRAAQKKSPILFTAQVAYLGYQFLSKAFGIGSTVLAFKRKKDVGTFNSAWDAYECFGILWITSPFLMNILIYVSNFYVYETFIFPEMKKQEGYEESVVERLARDALERDFAEVYDNNSLLSNITWGCLGVEVKKEFVSVDRSYTSLVQLPDDALEPSNEDTSDEKTIKEVVMLDMLDWKPDVATGLNSTRKIPEGMKTIKDVFDWHRKLLDTDATEFVEHRKSALKSWFAAHYMLRMRHNVFTGLLGMVTFTFVPALVPYLITHFLPGLLLFLPVAAFIVGIASAAAIVLLQKCDHYNLKDKAKYSPIIFTMFGILVSITAQIVFASTVYFYRSHDYLGAIGKTLGERTISSYVAFVQHIIAEEWEGFKSNYDWCFRLLCEVF